MCCWMNAVMPLGSQRMSRACCVFGVERVTEKLSFHWIDMGSLEIISGPDPTIVHGTKLRHGPATNEDPPQGSRWSHYDTGLTQRKHQVYQMGVPQSPSKNDTDDNII